MGCCSFLKDALHGDGSRIRLSACFFGGALCNPWMALMESMGDVPAGRSPWAILASLVVAMLWKLLCGANAGRAGLVCAIAGSASAFVTFLPEGESIFSITHVLQVVSATALSCLWCELYGRFPLRLLLTMLAGGQLVSLLLSFMFVFIPDIYCPGIALLLPLVSAGMLAHSLLLTDSLEDKKGLRDNRRANMRPEMGIAPRWQFLAVALLFSLAYGLSQENSSRVVNILAYGVSGLLILAGLVISKGRISVHLVFNVGLPLVLAGLIVGALLGSKIPAVSSMLINTGYALITVLFVALAADQSYRFGVSVLWTCGLVKAALSLGVLLGESFDALIVVAISPSMMPRSVVYLLMIGVLVAGSFIWMRDMLPDMDDKVAVPVVMEGSNVGTVGSVCQGDAIASDDLTLAFKADVFARCATVGREYVLTDREVEILNYLVMGWSAPRIEEELTISNSTVKTHMRHIYSKMGVHTRDELKAIVGVDTPFASSKAGAPASDDVSTKSE